MSFVVSQKILDKYADVLVNCALNDGKGIKRGEVVLLQVPECAKPLLFSLRRAVLKAGGHPIVQFFPDGDTRTSFARDFYKYASTKQLTFFPKKYLRGRIDEIDHSIGILADYKVHELKGINPKKIMLSQEAMLPYKQWMEDKESAKKFTWALALYGTKAMADEVNLTEKEYWNQIIKACYLDSPNPVKKWRAIMNQTLLLKKKLDSLRIQKIHLEAKNIDLWVGVGKNRNWLGGTGRNIPSFEIFISPDCRLTEGKISFNQPLYYFGNLIKGIALTFKKGKIIKATASENEKLLKEMIKVKGANRIGEFSLTDGRVSHITKFMGTTLYDENRGGKEGNTHIAVGSAYKDCFPGNPSKVSKKQWASMGYNESAIHVDIISTEKRRVTAFLEDGSQKVIYKNGKFVI